MPSWLWVQPSPQTHTLRWLSSFCHDPYQAIASKQGWDFLVSSFGPTFCVWFVKYSFLLFGKMVNNNTLSRRHIFLYDQRNRPSHSYWSIYIKILSYWAAHAEMSGRTRRGEYSGHCSEDSCSGNLRNPKYSWLINLGLSLTTTSSFKISQDLILKMKSRLSILADMTSKYPTEMTHTCIAWLLLKDGMPK